MKTKYSLLLLLALAFFSCNKNSNDVSSNQNRIVKYIEELNSFGIIIKDTFTVNYDNSGRVISLVATNPADRFNFTYNGNSSYTIDIINNGTLDIKFTGYLNSNGFVDSTFQYNNTNDSSTSKNIFSNSNKLIQEKNYSYSRNQGSNLLRYTTYVYDANENLLTETKYTPTNSVTERKAYEYTNIVASSPSFFGIGYPARNKNLVRKTTFYNSSNTITQTVDFAYTFDAMNRITSEKQLLLGGEVYTRSFIYE